MTEISRRALLQGCAGVLGASAAINSALASDIGSKNVELQPGDTILFQGDSITDAGRNRGISGNKVPDLDARWQEDCIDLHPDLLSILIGVNDIWHKLNENYDGSVAGYEQGFDALLARTRDALPSTRIIVCEPFALRCGAVDDRWHPEFDERRAAAKRVAEAGGTIWVPFQDIFDAAVAAGTTPEYWAPDGVHPSMAGHALMAEAWREYTGL